MKLHEVLLGARLAQAQLILQHTSRGSEHDDWLLKWDYPSIANQK